MYLLHQSTTSICLALMQRYISREEYAYLHAGSEEGAAAA